MQCSKSSTQDSILGCKYLFSRFIVHKSSKESKNIYADIIEGGFIAATNSIFPMWLLWIRKVMNENVNNVGENK